MRVLVLITSRHSRLNSDAISASVPQTLTSTHTVETFLAAHDQGFGANQKVVFRYALEKGFDAVAVFPYKHASALHKLTEMMAVLDADERVDGVLGAPSRGPVTSFLSFVQNLLCGSGLNGWHSGIRLYRTRVFKEIAYDLNASDEAFDTEVLLQMLYHGHSLQSVRINRWLGCPLAIWKPFKAALKFRLQKHHLFYDVRFHPDVLSDTSVDTPSTYNEKPRSVSPFTLVTTDEKLVSGGAHVLDVGCAGGYVGRRLSSLRNCRVTGVDRLPKERVWEGMEAYYQLDVEAERARFMSIVREGNFDTILALDVIEHMANPELFLWNLSKTAAGKPFRLVVSTGNVAFFIVRLMLLLGHFNYGQKGILDITHKRLFSYHTFKNLLEQTGFTVVEERYCPLPFAELGLPVWLAKIGEFINMALIRLRPRLFAYQVMFAATPLVSPQSVLTRIDR
jgi:2-polyprenyl-3-methyl-5-hydroxy-6-metoxy-1,4-benzoquinol methylase